MRTAAPTPGALNPAPAPAEEDPIHVLQECLDHSLIKYEKQLSYI